MNTLIELYDERAIENILAPDMFRPRRIVYLCPGEIAQDRTRQETLAAFFRRRGWEPELIFVETSLFKADRILRQLFTIGLHLLPEEKPLLRHFRCGLCRRAALRPDLFH